MSDFAYTEMKPMKRLPGMVLAEAKDLRLGLEVYIVSPNDANKVYPHRIRGPVRSDKKFTVTDFNGKEEWVYEEPAWSYNQYRSGIKRYITEGRLLILENEREKGNQGT